MFYPQCVFFFNLHISSLTNTLYSILVVTTKLFQQFAIAEENIYLFIINLLCLFVFIYAT